MPKPKRQVRKEKPATTVVVHEYPAFIAWAGRAAVSFADSAVLRWCLIFSLPLTVLLYYPTRGDDYDIWWHLKLGEHYITNMTTRVDHAIFSWTPADSGWIYNTWLGSTILYVAYYLLSGFGLWLIQWACLLGIAALYFFYLASVKEKTDVTNLTLILLVAFSLNVTAIYYKPEIFSTLFFTLSLFIYFYCKTHEKKYFLFYPLVFLVWVNLHGGYVMGLALISMLLAGETANYLLFEKNRLAGPLYRQFALSVLLSYPALLINPYGIDYPLFIMKAITDPEYMGPTAQVVAYTGMWQYVFPSAFSYRFVGTAWVHILFAAGFILLNIYAYVKTRFFDLVLIGLNAGFFFFGMSAGRYTIFFPLVCIFSIAYIFARIRAGDIGLKRKLAPVSLAVYLFVTVYIITTTVLFLDKRSWFGSGLHDFAPVREVEFIMNNKLPQPIFNDYLVGGYMIWKMYPEYKVMIDPRYGPFWKEVVPDYMRLIKGVSPETMKDFLERYPARLALIHISSGPMIVNLLATKEWGLLFFDRNAAVLIHKSLVGALSRETLITDMGPERFREEKNPVVLLNLFNFYIHIGPQFAQKIADYYNANVPGVFWDKRATLSIMQDSLNKKIEEIKQAQPKLQQQQNPPKNN